MKPLLVLSVLLLAISCSQPVSTESFIRGDGPYEFTVDMTDTTAAYDFALFTRIDATEFPSHIRLDITWKDPRGERFTEAVSLPVERGSAFFSQESYAPYREKMVPATPGMWTITITVPAPPSGLRGMGLVTKRVWDTEN